MLLSDSLRDKALVDKITIRKTGNYHLIVHPYRSGRSNVEVAVEMNESDLLDLKRQIEAALKRPNPVTEESMAKMISLFNFETPHALSFKYTERSFINKKPILERLLAEKKIVQVSKNNTEVVYKYIG